MKKIMAFLLVCMVAFSATAAFASDVKVTVNGEELTFDRNPIVDGETVLLPCRAIADKLGANVNWYGETQTVFVNSEGTITTLQIGNEKMFVNGESFRLDKAPVINIDRTLVPAAVFEKGLGAVVTWDKENSVVKIEK